MCQLHLMSPFFILVIKISRFRVAFTANGKREFVRRGEVFA